MRPIFHKTLLLFLTLQYAYSFLLNRGWNAPTSRTSLRRPYPFLLEIKRSAARLHVSRTPSSSSNNGVSSNDKNNEERVVVYQKIVSTPPKVDAVFFLGHLVDYLTEYFVLPSNLPIPFQVVPENQDEASVNVVVTWDSPLSSNSETTKLHVEVVGIFTSSDEKNNDTTESSVPNMAMVVVKKKKDVVQGTSSLPIMMKNLFDDSERQILKALDVGLEDFVAGKIKMKSQQTRPDNYENAQQAIQAEVLEQEEQDTVFDGKGGRATVAPEDVLIDTTAVPSNPEPTPNVAKENGIEDYAVNAARKAQELYKKKKKQDRVAVATNSVLESTETKGDFAVEAAKRIAKLEAKNKPQKNIGKTKPQSRISSNPTNSGANGFRATISTPRTWQKNKAKRLATAKVTKKKVVNNNKNNGKIDSDDRVKQRSLEVIPEPSTDVDNAVSTKSDSTRDIIDAQVVKPKNKTPKVDTKRKVNLRVVDNTNIESSAENEQLPFEQIIESKDDDDDKQYKIKELPKTQVKADKKEKPRNKKKKTVSKEQMERDVMEAAQKVMSEMTSDKNDIYPEELLQDVVEFGKAKDKEEAVGQGFASGAFEKAKELLQERQAIREQGNQRVGLEYKEVNRDVSSSLRPNIMDAKNAGDGTVNEGTKELSAEEELKRIFQAGEQMAEGRITTMSEEPADTLTTAENSKTAAEKEVDELIASEKTISSYARILDEDLAELEVRINKSPGEEVDGPRKNPVFDIFSGPELYNPNVDPETAVNWPGAQPGTKDVRLAKELDEAVKQAKFAAGALLEMREEADEDSTEKRYYVGKKELSREQVSSLRQCVDEAVQVGLISDPLVLLSERSRLQMVLDELANQPEERIQDIISNYKDLLLSENFVALVQDRLTAMADKDLEALRQDDTSLEEPHAKERELLGHLVNYAQTLLKETRALGAELEAAQLEIVRSICEVAMDPAHQTEEETAIALADAVRDMRPMLDDTFVAYLKYAVAEEEGRLARAGVLDDPEHNEWLFVLKIVQQGVYAEISRGISRYIDHIGYVLRMETKEDRRALLKKFIDVMPTMDVRPFVQVVDNIAGSLGDSVRGEFDGGVDLGEMSNKVLQLRRDTHDLLPPERIKLMSRDADEWAAEQRKRLMQQRKTAQQRLKAAQETKSYDEELRSRGEVERMD